jgi:toxin secretion/phage lysis holin
MENIIKSVIAGGGGVALYLWGGWTEGMLTLVILMGVDFVTGLFAAGKEKKLSSRTGAAGIARKVVSVGAVVAVANMADQMLGNGHVLRDGAVIFYLLNEGLSILENAGRMGIPIPDGITQAIEVLKGKGKKDGN